MPDKVELFVNKMKIEHFISYKIDSDLYKPADAFHLELANPETDIIAGKLCELYVNSQKELTGIIDKVQRKVTKGGVSLSVEGRDLMGLLLDSFVEAKDWVDVTNIKLKALAERLLTTVPYINRKTITYQANVVGKLKGKKTSSSGFRAGLDADQKINHIEPGMTIFDVLKNVSLSRGMLFYCLPDGTLVFGRPLAKGAPEFTLTMLKSGAGNNMIESEVVEDISRRYSKFVVVGQQQGSQTLFGAAEINTVSPPQIDPTFPFYKPFVGRDNNDNVSPAMRARMIMEKQRREGTHLNYVVGRHTQDNKNWAINTMCSVKDEVQGIDGDFLIYGRTFEMNKQTGPITQVRLGKPGLIS